MKRGWFFVCLMAILCLWIAGSASPAPVFRLQVLAASDSDLDQAEKLRVKNRVVSCLSPLLSGCEDVGEVYRLTSQLCPRIEQEAQLALADSCRSHSVQARVGVFPFPEKSYQGVRYPAGPYLALRVTLDEGEGANWWCMLYPPLCLGTEPTYYRSWILDLMGLGVTWKGDVHPWQ